MAALPDFVMPEVCCALIEKNRPRHQRSNVLRCVCTGVKLVRSEVESCGPEKKSLLSLRGAAGVVVGAVMMKPGLIM